MRPTVRQNGDGYAYAQHLRKAGGTLLRTYLAMYRCAPLRQAMSATQLYRLPRGEPRQGTAPAAAQESLAFNTQNFVLRPATVHITLIDIPSTVLKVYIFSRANGHRRAIEEQKRRLSV